MKIGMWLLKATVPVFGILLLLLALLLTWLNFADLSRYRHFIEVPLEAAIGRQVTIDGEIDVQLSLTPRISISEFSIANAIWSSTPDMLAVERADVQLSLGRLFNGELPLKRLTVNGLRVRIENDSGGVSNWQLGEPTGASDSEAPFYDHIERFTLPPTLGLTVNDALLTYSDARIGRETVLRLSRIAVAKSALKKPLEVMIDGSVNDHELKLAAAFDMAEQTATERTIPLSVDITVADIVGNIIGTIQLPPGAPRFDIGVTTRAETMDAIRQIGDYKLPLPEPFSLVMQVVGDTSDITFSDIEVELGALRAGGSVNMLLHNARPQLRANLAVSDFDVTMFTAAIPVVDKDRATRLKELFERPFSMDFLNTLDMEAVLQGKNLNLPETEIRSVEGNVSLRDGKLLIAPLLLSLEAGDIEGKLVAEDGKGSSSIVIDAVTQQLALAKLPGWAGTKNDLSGTINGAVSFRGQGDSLAALLNTFNGDINITYRDNNQAHQLDFALNSSISSRSGNAAPLTLRGGTHINEVGYQFEGRLGSLNSLLFGAGPYPMNIKLSALGITSSIHGNLGRPFHRGIVDLMVDAQMPVSQTAVAHFGKLVTQGAPINLSTHVTGHRERLTFSDLVTRTALGEMTGEATLSIGARRPRVVADLELNDIVLDNLWRTKENNRSRKRRADEPFSLNVLDQLDARITVRGNNLRAGEFSAQRIDTKILLNNGKLLVTPITITTEGGQLSATAFIDARTDPPQLKLDLLTQPLDISKLMPNAQLARLESGVVRINGALKSWGQTTAELLQAITGNIRIWYRNDVKDQRLTVRLSRDSREGEEQDQSVRISIDGDIGNHGLEVLGSLGPPDRLYNLMPYPVRINASALGIVTDITGTLGNLTTGEGTDVNVSISAPEFDRLKERLGDWITHLAPMRGTMNLTGNWSELTFGNVRINAGEGQIDGTMKYVGKGQRPALLGDVAVANVDVSPWFKDTKADQHQEELFSTEPLPFNVMRQVDFRGELLGKNITFPANVANELQLKVALENGLMDATVLSSAAIGGEGNAHLTIDTRQPEPTFHLEFDTPTLYLDKALTRTQFEGLVEGEIAADVLLKGKGNNVRDIAASLDGRIRLLMEDGYAKAQALDRLVGGARAVLGTMFTRRAELSVINCAICDLTIDAGLVTTQLGLVDTQFSTIVVDGQIDLAKEELNIEVIPRAKGVTLSVATPVSLAGSIIEPTFTVQRGSALATVGELVTTIAYPPLALLAFKDLGSGERNPCVTLVAPSARLPQRAIKKAGKITGEALQGVGEAAGNTVRGMSEGARRTLPSNGSVDGGNKEDKE